MTRAKVIARARSVKHAGWLARKRIWSRVEPAVAPGIDAALRVYTRALPPPMPSRDPVAVERAAERIFCLWTGHNAMSRNRLRAMARIRRLNEPDLDVVLVTPDNLGEWIVPGHPLHAAYDDLALIHRSDYLRTYLLHHHGGGYTDVKAAQHSWRPLFDGLNRDQDAWLLGYQEPSYRFVAPAPPGLHRRLVMHHARLLGNGAYIVRPRTPFTREWLAEAERRLDVWQDDLRLRPGAVYGAVGYPVPFYGLLGEIFHPLCLQHHGRLRQDERITPQLQDYK